jgi:fumarylacetoacetase
MPAQRHPNDVSLRSFVDVPAHSDFPIQNLPYGVFSTEGDPHARIGVAIGNHILDLSFLETCELLVARTDGPSVFRRGSINPFVALGRSTWTRVRERISTLLRSDNPELRDDWALRKSALVPMQSARLHLPLAVCGYTDFYSSKEHATNVGAMFRGPEHALLPNWLELPVAYNGRASSVVVSGTPIRRPVGQTKSPGMARPLLEPCRKLDMEVETAFIVGVPNSSGEPIAIARAEEHIFGMVLMNDWSARDIQQWEYVPLGPFNGKSFATSISPWIVTLEALEPFRVLGPPQEPEPLSYLRQAGAGTFDINLETSLQPDGASRPTRISRSNFRDLYWTMAQQLAHHTISGCSMRVGDLLGSGTISGSTADSLGSMLELTGDGRRPLSLADGTLRSFLEDGDQITIVGWCEAADYRIGFGELTGRVSSSFMGPPQALT